MIISDYRERYRVIGKHRSIWGGVAVTLALAGCGSDASEATTIEEAPSSLEVTVAPTTTAAAATETTATEIPTTTEAEVDRELLVLEGLPVDVDFRSCTIEVEGFENSDGQQAREYEMLIRIANPTDQDVGMNVEGAFIDVDQVLLSDYVSGSALTPVMPGQTVEIRLWGYTYDLPSEQIGACQISGVTIFDPETYEAVEIPG